MSRWSYEKKILNFAKKISEPDENGCIRWLGTYNPNGYGKAQLLLDGVMYHGAHRVAFVMIHGHIPEGKYVCHSCDNKWCVNPDHLWLGAPVENSRDMVEKGRKNNPWFGKKHKPETIEKMKKPKSENHKMNMSIAARKRYEK